LRQATATTQPCAWAHRGRFAARWPWQTRSRVAFAFTITRGKITGIDLIAEARRIRDLNPVMLDD
jgi:hypothetical protein